MRWAAKKDPVAPRYLGKAAKKFWRDIIALWQFDSGGLRLLESACQALDDCEACRETIAAVGRFTKNRYGGVVEHPALAAGLKARAQFAAILKQLDLRDEQAPPKIGRPGMDAARQRLIDRGKGTSWQ